MATLLILLLLFWLLFGGLGLRGGTFSGEVFAIVLVVLVALLFLGFV